MLVFTFNGDGIKTCKCCGKRITSRCIYEGVCSSTCSSQQLEYNSIPINSLFIKRIYLHIKDEPTREEEIQKFIKINKLNDEMTRYKIKRVSEYLLQNKLHKLETRRKYIYNIG